jgi:hypothetical protein
MHPLVAGSCSEMFTTVIQIYKKNPFGLLLDALIRLKCFEFTSDTVTNNTKM